MVSNVDVWCVYRTGGVYTPEYVERLSRDVAQYAGRKLLVASDDPFVQPDYLMENPFPGWWSKIELFKVATGPTLYFDLDTVIHGDLGPMIRAAEQYPFVMLEDFTVPKEFGSGVMSWRENMSFIWKHFEENASRVIADYTRRPKFGDQDFIRDTLQHDMVIPKTWQNVCPGAVCSWKVGEPGYAVTCYHGSPKPHETGWARR